MSGLLAALIGILAAFGLLVLLVLRTLKRAVDPLPSLVEKWRGHTAVSFFNHPPQTWAAP